MKKSANWMVNEDDRILEYFSREDPSSWWQIAHDFHLGGRLVRTRLSVLTKAGWVVNNDAATSPISGRSRHVASAISPGMSRTS